MTYGLAWKNKQTEEHSDGTNEGRSNRGNAGKKQSIHYCLSNVGVGIDVHAERVSSLCEDVHFEDGDGKEGTSMQAL